MSTIDLPENLQPATLLCDVEDALAPESQEIIRLCKKVEVGNQKSVEAVVREVERMWTRYGDELGHAVAFLYLADTYWKCRDTARAIEFCNRTFTSLFGDVPGASKPQALRRGLATLRDNLWHYFNSSEMQALCIELGIGFDDLQGNTKSCKARELVALLEREGRLPELITNCSLKRPQVPWKDILNLIQQAQVPASSHREWLPVSVTVKAVKYYLLGLSYQTSGGLSDAFHAYNKAFDEFQQAQGHWQDWECNQQFHAYGDILDWTKRLAAYVRDLQSNSQRGAAASQKLICPWQSSIREQEYAVAELDLAAPVATQQVNDKTTADFITRRAQSWYCIGNTQIDGYKVGKQARVVWPNHASRDFDVRLVNTAARLDDDLVLPAGAPYSVLFIDAQHALPAKGIQSGDYVLACGAVIPPPDALDRVELFPYKGGEDIILGAFGRDATGNIYQKFTPPIVLGEDLTGLNPWQVDYVLRLLPSPPPGPDQLPHILRHT